MEYSQRLQNVIIFTCDKRLRASAVESLRIIEEKHKYIKSLESILIKAGIGNYENSKESYLKDRKIILDSLGASLRELNQLDNLIK